MDDRPRDTARRPPAKTVGRRLSQLLYGCWRLGALAVDPRLVDAVGPNVMDCGLSGLVGRCTPVTARSSRVAREFMAAARADAGAAARLDSQLPVVVRALAKSGVDAVVLKGWAVARYYPSPGLRPYSDIDVCVAPKQGETARRVLHGLDAAGVPVDLHVGLPDLPQRTWAEVFFRAQPIEVDGVGIRVLAPEDQFRWLAVHLVRHVCHRPLWLIDLAVLMETAGEEMDWDLCLRGSHVWRRWLLAVAGLAGRLLGAQLPIKIANLPGAQPPDWLVDLTLWRWGGGDALRGRELLKRRDEWWRYVAHKVLNPVRWAYRLGLPPMRFVPPIWGASIMARSVQPYPRIWRALAKFRRVPGLFPVHEQRVF